MMPHARPMHPAVAWVLTRRIPCALLAALLFSSGMWAGGLTLTPLLALHLLTPALFALIAMGGGLLFGLQVALIAAALLILSARGDVAPGLMLLAMYALLPMLAARTLKGPDGLSRSAWQLAIGVGCAMLAALIAGSQGGDPEAMVTRMLAPMLDAMARQQPLDAEALARIRLTSAWMFPGLTALVLWSIWWGDVVLARGIAIRHGFFRGDARPFSALRLGPPAAWVFLGLIAACLIADGTLRYLAFAAMLLAGGLITAQGLAVLHAWLRARGLPWMLAALYVVLLIQPVMLLPFTVAGLLDVWLDYRRRITPVNGGR